MCIGLSLAYNIYQSRLLGGMRVLHTTSLREGCLELPLTAPRVCGTVSYHIQGSQSYIEPKQIQVPMASMTQGRLRRHRCRCCRAAAVDAVAAPATAAAAFKLLPTATAAAAAAVAAAAAAAGQDRYTPTPSAPINDLTSCLRCPPVHHSGIT